MKIQGIIKSKCEGCQSDSASQIAHTGILGCITLEVEMLNEYIDQAGLNMNAQFVKSFMESIFEHFNIKQKQEISLIIEACQSFGVLDSVCTDLKISYSATKHINAPLLELFEFFYKEMMYTLTP